MRDEIDGQERDRADGDWWIGRIKGESERACMLVLPESAYVLTQCVCVVIIHLQ